MASVLLTGCDIFDGERVHADAALRIEDGLVAAITTADASADEVMELDGALLAPGFVDLQVNGGGGVLFNDEPSLDGMRQIIAAHRAGGTTACLPTLISDDADVMRAGISAVDQAVRQSEPGVLGIHLEGPHLNPLRRGVHDAERIRALDADALQLLSSLQHGKTLVTLAPEVVGAADIMRLVAAGVTVFGGHSAASYAQVRAALDAGLSGFTHLFNAMSPLTSREPGMVGAALEDANSYVGIIADGYHVHAATLAIAIRAKARGKTVLVTDAMPSVGAANSVFELQGQVIQVSSGRCVTTEGVLAGSNIMMIDAVKFVTRQGIVERDEALRMAAAYPAAAIGLDDSLGYLKPGFRANVVALDDQLRVTHTWIDGIVEVHG